ncbi:MAG: peptidoglycan-binding protein, partial [Oscillospiraceae bacterium]|nr:peptidoglycan-binding protein [Oscillospiraceae bacterium]
MANLAYGSSGSDVRALQEALRKAGYNIAADGVYGAETRNAVRQYQSAQGLGVDGIAGQQTFGSLGIGSGGSTAGGG